MCKILPQIWNIFYICLKVLKITFHFSKFADLRMKMEPGMQQDEPPTSTAGGGSGCGGGGNVLNTGGGKAANGSIGPQTNYNHDRDKDLLPLWSTVAGKLSHKTGTVNTPDGE